MRLQLAELIHEAGCPGVNNASRLLLRDQECNLPTRPFSCAPVTIPQSGARGPATLKRHHEDPFIQQAPLIVETIIEAA